MLDLLYPPTCIRCNALLLSRAQHPLCTVCEQGHAQLPIEARRVGRIDALYPYDGPVGDAIKRMKFGGDMGLAGPLGRMLSGAPILYETPVGRPWDLLCAVPLHTTRRWVRGFDQAQLLAQWAIHHAAKTLGPPLPSFEPRLLKRKRATSPQSDLSAVERVANIRGAFSVRGYSELEGATVLVVDDVCTTGATLHACFEALREGGASIVAGLCLARTLVDAQEVAPAISA